MLQLFLRYDSIVSRFAAPGSGLTNSPGFTSSLTTGSGLNSAPAFLRKSEADSGPAGRFASAASPIPGLRSRFPVPSGTLDRSASQPAPVSIRPRRLSANQGPGSARPHRPEYRTRCYLPAKINKKPDIPRFRVRDLHFLSYLCHEQTAAPVRRSPESSRSSDRRVPAGFSIRGYGVIGSHVRLRI